MLEKALIDKMAAAQAAGLDVLLVNQLLFDAKPLVAFVRRLRAQGISAPLRVGVAGPASRTSLIKFGLRCGVGASLRALRERQELARNAMTGETPEGLLTEIALAYADDPSLDIEGVHFFTFGATRKSIEWAQSNS